MMRVYGIRTLRRWARRAWLATHPKGIILGYHRVAELSSDPQLLSVTPKHFVEHLEYVREHYRPMSLDEVGRALEARSVPNYALVITFDDGYADNVRNAMPLLEQYGVPATVFVTTSYVGQNRGFWWDELEKLLLLPQKLPEKLELNINGEWHEWTLSKIGEQTTWSGAWDVTMKTCPSLRHEVYKDLHRLLRPLEDVRQQHILTELARQVRASEDGCPDHRVLGADELKALDDSRLVEIGSHTVTHPVLSSQPRDVRRGEIVRSKEYLEEILGHQVNAFSYPYGSTRDVGEDAIRLVREAGYKVACANFAAPVTRRSNPYWLPRFLVRDWDGEEFACRLRRWLRG